MRAFGIVGGHRQLALQLPYHAGDHLESQAGLRLIDVEAGRKPDALVGNPDMEMLVDFPRADLDNATAIGVSVFHRVCNEFVDQKP